MDEHRWQDAVSAFDKVIGEKGKRVDAALYWKLTHSINSENTTRDCHLRSAPLTVCGQFVEQGLQYYFGRCTD